MLAAPAQAAPQLVKAGDFASPTYATGAPGDASRIFVTEKAGRVRVIRDGAVLARPFLDLTSSTLSSADERGLLSVAFAPDYASSGRFYVYLTSRPAGAIEVREYRRSASDPDAADPASARLLLSIPHSEAANHNGGQLQFGPDGKLWLGTGDGGGGDDQFGHAQDPGSLLGKLIRLDPAAPAPEIVARGLRNPWRFSFDRATGPLVIGDVGQDEREEIDAGLAANYGWPCWEGRSRHASSPASCDSGTAMPVIDHAHSDGFCAITGGYVVRDPGLPTLAGRYLYGDFCEGELRSVDLANPASNGRIGLSVGSLSSFGEDACGRLLVVSLDGPVYRLVDGAPSPCTVATPPVGGAPPPPGAVTRRCRLRARITGLRRVRHRHRVTVALRTDLACRVTVTGRVRGVASFRKARRSLVPGRRTVVRLRLRKRGVHAVRRALHRHRSLKTVVRVHAAGGARLKRTVRVRG